MLLNNTLILLIHSLKQAASFATEWEVSAYRTFVQCSHPIQTDYSIIKLPHFFTFPIILNPLLITPSIHILITITLLIVGVLLFITSFVILKKLRRPTKNLSKENTKRNEDTAILNVLKQDFKNQKMEVEELHKHYGQLIEMMVHDLKNPLNIIYHSLENIPNSSTKQSLENASNLMIHMLQNTLDIQKYTNSKIPINLETINLVDLISDTIQSVEYFTQKKDINIIYKSDLNFWVHVDYSLIKRVVISLLINLIKHTPFNETIVIGSELHEDSLKLSITSTTDKKETNHIEHFFDSDNMSHQAPHLSTLFQCFRFCKLAISSHKQFFGFNKDDLNRSKIWFTLPLTNSTNNPSEIITNLKTKQFLFSDKDIKTVTIYVDELHKHSIFELSKIKSIINKIPNSSDCVIEWKEHVSLALSSMNEKRFILLLDSVSKSTMTHEE